MKYQDRQEYLELKSGEKKKEQNHNVIFTGGFDSNEVKSSIITESMRKDFQQYLDSLPNLNDFYKDIREILRQGHVFWLLSDIFLLHINCLAVPWKIDYLIGLLTSIDLNLPLK